MAANTSRTKYKLHNFSVPAEIKIKKINPHLALSAKSITLIQQLFYDQILICLIFPAVLLGQSTEARKIYTNFPHYYIEPYWLLLLFI